MGYTVGERDERPWGTWEVVDLGPGFAVKRILIRAGHRVSLQRHRHRSEHWIIVAGRAVVTLGGNTHHLASGGHVEIACGDLHRIENRDGPGDLVFIEIQRGDHLAETDIERFQDDYGRSGGLDQENRYTLSSRHAAPKNANPAFTK